MFSYSLNIVIVNWNSGEQLLDCLLSIDQSNIDFILESVTVVDNNSSDSSLSGIEKLDLPLMLIRNSENLGFGAACNQGAATSESDYVLFLNPDTLLSPQSLSVALRTIVTNKSKDVGIVGVQLVNEKQHVAKSCYRFPKVRYYFNKCFLLHRIFTSQYTQMNEWDHSSQRYVDQIMGAFFLVDSDLFNKLNGFDERFFVYYEEVDFSKRASEMGYLSLYTPDTRVFHKGGGTSEQVKATRLFYSLRSRQLYAKKHFNNLNTFLLNVITYYLEFPSRLMQASLRCSIDDFKNVVKAYILLFRD